MRMGGGGLRDWVAAVSENRWRRWGEYSLAPANYSGLTAAFGTVPDVEHIRLIRNATAHLNPETLADVLAFQSAYGATPVSHPLQALLWIDRATGKTLAQARIDDMRIAARNACN